MIEMLNKIFNENNLDTMARMSNNFIDLTITSPPYDNLRTYNGYEWDFEKVAKELFRITKNGGVVVWIVGDETIDGSESGTSFKQALYFKEIGFNLHDTMIYKKNPHYSDLIRYRNEFEYMFILSKGKPKTFNPIKIKCNTTNRGSKCSTNRQKDGSLIKSKRYKTAELKIKGNIWHYDTGYMLSIKDIVAFNHPAIFPEALVRDHILSWSNENDIVYDPFMGSGTTAKMCLCLRRYYIGSEISKKYCYIAQKRIENYLAQYEIEYD